MMTPFRKKRIPELKGHMPGYSFYLMKSHPRVAEKVFKTIPAIIMIVSIITGPVNHRENPIVIYRS